MTPSTLAALNAVRGLAAMPQRGGGGGMGMPGGAPRPQASLEASPMLAGLGAMSKAGEFVKSMRDKPPAGQVPGLEGLGPNGQSLLGPPGANMLPQLTPGFDPSFPTQLPQTVTPQVAPFQVDPSMWNFNLGALR